MRDAATHLRLSLLSLESFPGIMSCGRRVAWRSDVLVAKSGRGLKQERGFSGFITVRVPRLKCRSAQRDSIEDQIAGSGAKCRRRGIRSVLGNDAMKRVPRAWSETTGPGRCFRFCLGWGSAAECSILRMENVERRLRQTESVDFSNALKSPLALDLEILSKQPWGTAS